MDDLILEHHNVYIQVASDTARLLKTCESACAAVEDVNSADPSSLARARSALKEWGALIAQRTYSASRVAAAYSHASRDPLFEQTMSEVQKMLKTSTVELCLAPSRFGRFFVLFSSEN